MKTKKSCTLYCILSLILLFGRVPEKIMAQGLEHPEWGFTDFDARTDYYPDDLTGPAVQAAINDASSNGGGTVWIKAGIIEITQNITMKSNVKLKGELGNDGSRSVTIRAKNQLVEGIIVARKDVKNTTVENLILDGAGFDHHGIAYIYGPDNFLIANNKIINIGYEKINTNSVILASRSDNPTAINMWSNNNFAQGFTIKENTISRVAKHGIDINNGRSFILTDNSIERAFMGYDASTGSQNGEILGNTVVNCIFGAKIVGSNSKDVIMHHNNHHNLDDRPYYSKGWGWEYDSGTALILQGAGTGIVVKNNILSGTTLKKGIAYWDGGKNGATITDNDTTPSSPTVVGEETQGNNLLNDFNLEQNYPNPFNPNTTIYYMLPKVSHVSITVYNTRGQKVAELVNQEMKAGRHHVNFDAANLTSGLYFYSIHAGNFRDVHKMMLLK